ncbi:MAG: hypothetical protein R3E10_13660 [Gemmatimonadota bacterium]
MAEPGEQGLWAELKRRSVVKVGAAYAAAAFVVLQLAEIVLPALGLPEWSLTLVVVLAAAGLPVALVLSWAFDLTPEGVRRTRSDGQSQPFGPRRRRIVQGAALAVSAAVLGAAGWWSVRHRSLGPDAPPASIAVLPFIDLSPLGDQAYLGDGMAEEILNLLTRLDGLRVAARTSAFVFRGQEVDIRDVGETLSVAHVLEGSVRKDRDEIRITAQLIDVETGYHVWSNTYQRTLDSVFEIQDEIARVIVEALRGTLTPRDRARLSQSDATTSEAFEAYLRGRMEWNRRTPDGLRAAVEHFEAAIAEDASYAKAHAGLADAWALLPLFDPAGVDAEGAWVRAEAAAARALALDPELAEAHASLGLIHGFRYRLQRGVAELERAIELNPAYAPARHWHSLQLSELGRGGEAVEEARVAHELDPLSMPIRTDLGYALLWAGRALDAKRAFQDALELSADYPPAWFGLALASLWTDDQAGFESAARRWAAASAENQASLAPLLERAVARRAGGPTISVAAEVAALSRATAGARATLAALAGDTATAWVWLERSRSDRSYADHYPAVNPAFAALRTDVRFRAFLERLRDG